MSDHVPGNRLRLAAALAAALLCTPAGGAPVELLPPVVGASETYRPDPRTGLALGGFDPVSYHLPGGPLGGRPEHEILWRGAAWRFASEANRQAFLAAPEAFAPRIGGRDAAAAASGLLSDADPGLFLVRDERLYLFRTEAARAAFAADPDMRLRAEEGWRALAGSLVER